METRRSDPGRPTVLAIGCHPDDIEFMMAGTLLHLGDRGWQIHCLNVADGSCGTDRLGAEEIAAIRLGEARESARLMGAVHHSCLARDLEVFYEQPLIRRLAAVIRLVRPRIVLTQSLEDYMADHMNAARAAVTAAFCRGMRNYPSDPPVPASLWDLSLYHATPHTLRDMMRRPVVPDLFVDVAPVMERKVSLLACHRSQKEWLDASQGMGSYLEGMRQASRAVGALSGRYEEAEGWRRHLHVGFSSRDEDPLAEALGPDRCCCALQGRNA
jgi:LmbE family N-acetylglucosaminyl deacetylase